MINQMNVTLLFLRICLPLSATKFTDYCPVKALNNMSVLKYLKFTKDFWLFKKLHREKNRFLLCWHDRYLCLQDNTQKTRFDSHYIYHPAWGARILAQTMPKVHVDISSSLHFCTLVSAFIPVKYYDYRPADIKLENLSSESANLLSLPFADGSIQSLSCMHVVEHVGLGRYGDSLDPDGDLKAAAELKRVLAHGGSLLFVVPVGKPKIAFNAHRIYSYSQVISLFPELILKEFTLIPDNHSDVGLVRQASRELADKQTYGCGCFWFYKANNDTKPNC